MVTKLLSLHTEERILLYLSDFGDLDDVFEAPSDVTQKEIAMNVRVQRKHISRYLKKLMEDGLVDETVCHVQGAKQRMKCYSLSWSGRRRAKDIRKHVGGKRVKLLVGNELKEMAVSEIDGATSVHLTLSDIVGEAMEAGDHLVMDKLEQIEERKRREMDQKTRKAEVYRNALVVAWRSGVLTSSEKHLIDALREHLGVTEKEHNSMEKKIIDSIPPLRGVHVDLYDDILTIIDGQPTDREEEILTLIKQKYDRK